MRYDNGEEVFDYSWLCPFNRAQLLEIAAISEFDGVRSLMASANADTAHDIEHTWRLIQKYYVNPDDTLLGKMRLASLNAYDRGISSLMEGVDDQVERNMEELFRR